MEVHGNYRLVECKSWCELLQPDITQIVLGKQQLGEIDQAKHDPIG